MLIAFPLIIIISKAIKKMRSDKCNYTENFTKYMREMHQDNRLDEENIHYYVCLFGSVEDIETWYGNYQAFYEMIKDDLYILGLFIAIIENNENYDVNSQKIKLCYDLELFSGDRFVEIVNEIVHDDDPDYNVSDQMVNYLKNLYQV